MKILFIGNSYTYFNMMPMLFARLARANGKDVTVDSVTRGGWYLRWFLERNNEQARQIDWLAKNDHYDVCVLQDQSTAPITAMETFRDGVTGMVEKLKHCADRFFLYETWGRKEGHSTLAELNLSREAMTDQLAAAYALLGNELGIPISPVGRNFQKLNQLRPDLELFDPDLTHPGILGSCLAAVTHYYAIFREMPNDMSVLGLKEDVASIFAQIVEENGNRDIEEC